MADKKQQEKHIGFGIKATPNEGADKNDPFQGGIGVRGNALVGKVISTKSAKTATIQMERTATVPKYKRLIKRTYKVKAHNPDTINAQDGDLVRIMETRPLSKTKHFCVVEIIKREE